MLILLCCIKIKLSFILLNLCYTMIIVQLNIVIIIHLQLRMLLFDEVTQYKIRIY